MKLKVERSSGVAVVSGGVWAGAPWASLDLEEISLNTGWFKLTAIGSSGVCLQLSQVDGFKVVELSGQSMAATYVRFEGGIFSPKVIFGVRPGFYPVKEVLLSRVSIFERLSVMFRRLLGAIRNKTSFTKILGLVRLAVSGKGTFGLRVTSTVGPNSLGLLTAADLACHDIEADENGLLARVSRLAKTPEFLITYRSGPIDSDEHVKLGLHAQAYDFFHTNHDTHYDYKVVIDEGQVLSKDALLLFAEVVNNDGGANVILADVWCGDIPTTRVAFDPLLYSEDEYPTPHAVKSSMLIPVSDRWADRQKHYAVINVPIATARQFVYRPRQIELSTSLKKPLVSVIIPTRDRADLLSSCLSGLFENTDWPHEVIVVDNGSVEEETFNIFREYIPKGLRVIREDIEFNFSTLCNVGASHANGEFIVFMNNDIILMNNHWMEEMLKYARMGDVGAVGARLHYSDLSLQHAGIALGLTETCGHIYHGLSFDDQEMIPILINASLRSAVTAALLCVEKAKFDHVGGFDAENFPVTLNDVDLCLKLKASGFFTVYAPSARAFHLEGVSRGKDVTSEKAKRRNVELERFTAKWQSAINDDPWLPLAYSRASELLTFR
jgi:GT2 family glycosyltransferase